MNGQEIHIKGIAKLDLKFGDYLITIDVLVTENLNYNYLSTNKLNIYQIFYEECSSGLFLNHQDKKFPLLKNNDNFSVVPHHHFVKPQVTTSINSIHQKLLHPNNEYLKKMIKDQLINTSETATTDQCTTCLQAKTTSAPARANSRNIHRVKSPFHQVHTDILTITSHNNYKSYVLTFYDDFTKLLKLYHLHSKNQEVIYECFQDYITFTTNQFKTNIKMFTSDNGSEYINKSVKSLIKDHGIDWMYTSAYSPNQNGSAERINYSIINKLKSALIDSPDVRVGTKYIKFCLPYILKYIEIILNISYHSALKTSPYNFITTKLSTDQYSAEIGCYKSINFDKIPVIGQTCYITNKTNTIKTNSRTVSGIFIGLDKNLKIFYVPDENKIIKTRNFSFKKIPDIHFSISSDESQTESDDEQENNDASDDEEDVGQHDSNDNNHKDGDIDMDDAYSENEQDTEDKNLEDPTWTPESEDEFEQHEEEENDLLDDGSNIEPDENEIIEEPQEDVNNVEPKVTTMDNPVVNDESVEEPIVNDDIPVVNEETEGNTVEEEVVEPEVVADTIEESIEEPGKVPDVVEDSIEEPVKDPEVVEEIIEEPEVVIDKTVEEPETVIDKQEGLDSTDETATVDPNSDIVGEPDDPPVEKTNDDSSTPLVIVNDTIEGKEENFAHEMFDSPNDDKMSSRHNVKMKPSKVVRVGPDTQPTPVIPSKRKLISSEAQRNISDYIKDRSSKIKRIGSVNICSIKELNDKVERNYWLLAILKELETLINQGTFEEVIIRKSQLSNYNIVPTLWLLNKKFDHTNNQIFKGRLVARGDLQEYEGETYSYTLENQILLSLLAIATKTNQQITQLDIKSAYVSAEIDQELYIKPPPFYKRFQQQEVPDDDHMLILRLKKSLYGLRQSGRQFYYHLRDILLKIGFTNSDAYPCVYKMDYQNQRCYLTNFVDDLLLIGPTEFKNFILKKPSDHNLDVKHLMPTTESVDDKTILKRKIVGVELEELYEDNIRKSLKVHQKTYLEKIVNKFLKINDSTKATPPPYYIDTSYTEGADHGQRVKKAQEIIGSLLYLGCHTRPDVIFHIHYISQFQKQPSDQVFYFLDRLLRYLNGTKEYGLNYYHSTATEIDENRLQIYTDASFAAAADNFKSSSGTIAYFVGGPIGWNTEVLSFNVLSPAEAEVVAITDSVKFDLWLRRLFDFLLEPKVLNKSIHYSDSSAGIAMINKDYYNKKNRHFNIRLAFARDKFKRGFYDLKFIATDKQVADLLTKPTDGVQFLRLVNSLVH